MAHEIPSLAMALLLAAVFCLGSSAFASEYDAGKSLYMNKCMICHGIDGKGNGPGAMALTKPPQDFNRPDFWNQNNVEQIITNQVKNGKGQMPAFDLTADQIKAIINFMSHTFQGKK